MSNRRRDRTAILILPAGLFFLMFFVLPQAALLAISLNPPSMSSVTLKPELTLQNYAWMLSSGPVMSAALRSVLMAVLIAVCTLVLAYPLSYFIARKASPRMATAILTVTVICMQLDFVIRIYGLMVLLGDNGLINAPLLDSGIIQAPLPLMYNLLGVCIGYVQICLPIMVLSLVASLRGIDRSLEEAARSLGAHPFRAFRAVVLPLSIPGVLTGSLLTFGIAISGFSVPVLLGGWKVAVLPTVIFQRMMQMGQWQQGATVALLLLVISLVAIAAYQVIADRITRGWA